MSTVVWGAGDVRTRWGVRGAVAVVVLLAIGLGALVSVAAQRESRHPAGADAGCRAAGVISERVVCYPK